MGANQFRGGYEFDSETYATGGGLAGMLRRAMHEQSLRDQGVDPGSVPDGAPEYQPDNYRSPQGGLLGRLIAAQTEQSRYQPVPEAARSAPLTPRDPNFRQLARLPAPVQQEGKIGTSRPDDELIATHPRLGTDAPAQTGRSLPDRIQSYWDQPHPHGLIAMLKEVTNGIAHAVQGSIDATGASSTEEQAFRQNQGRKLGPVGAFQAVSALAPTVPKGTGGIFAVPLAGALHSGLPWLPAGARIADRGVNGPIVAGLEDRFRRR
jgi:hypothetical protein